MRLISLAIIGSGAGLVNDVAITADTVILSLENQSNETLRVRIESYPLEIINTVAAGWKSDGLWKTAEYLTSLLNALERAQRSGDPLNIIFHYVSKRVGEIEEEIDMEDWNERVEAWDVRHRLRRRRNEFCRDRLFWLNLRPPSPSIKCRGDERCEGIARETYISRELEFGIISFLDSAFHEHHRSKLYRVLHDVVCHPRVRRIALDEWVTRREEPIIIPPVLNEEQPEKFEEETDFVVASFQDIAVDASCVPEMNPFNPNDSKYKQQWHLEGINAQYAWPLTRSVAVGSPIALVIDSGIRADHPDLKDNLWVNQAELNGKPGVDDDNNGYVDDIYGIAISNGHVTGDVTDEDGHGTFCAGEIAAVTNNSLGVAGMGTKTRVATCKFFSTGVS
eukprot:Gregarina_sp_Poly_1__11101@NODE_897_length_5808_cov_21_397318_g641_i0_p2_GENE_NODE_897_length_5808_cov_21_397318_g641_i0NODE_897_length_5808_cov_21_397318_g641_i0_p2_ORF_typecomplete_len393_score36_15Peptidase_S8/PF00082_22/2_1e11_NODE_897_length_5808_cov_21_397318_g641_i029104088